jgi:hypothetical protein
MQIAPTTAKLLFLGILSMVWLALLNQARQLDNGEAFYVAIDRRDKRLSRFYSRSMWTGIGAAFLSLLCLDAFETIAFDSHAQRDLITGVTRATGMWGLLIIGAVWSQLGSKVRDLKFDFRSLQPIDSNRKDRRDGRDDGSDR